MRGVIKEEPVVEVCCSVVKPEEVVAVGKKWVYYEGLGWGLKVENEGIGMCIDWEYRGRLEKKEESKGLS